MIIKTRFRNIPFEAAAQCCRYPDELVQAYWPDHRGTVIRIETPQCTNEHPTFLCDGPFYHLVGTSHCVCPHIAEIGD